MGSRRKVGSTPLATMKTFGLVLLLIAFLCGAASGQSFANQLKNCEDEIDYKGKVDHWFFRFLLENSQTQSFTSNGDLRDGVVALYQNYSHSASVDPGKFCERAFNGQTMRQYVDQGFQLFGFKSNRLDDFADAAILHGIITVDDRPIVSGKKSTIAWSDLGREALEAMKDEVAYEFLSGPSYVPTPQKKFGVMEILRKTNIESRSFFIWILYRWKRIFS